MMWKHINLEELFSGKEMVLRQNAGAPVPYSATVINKGKEGRLGGLVG